MARDFMVCKRYSNKFKGFEMPNGSFYGSVKIGSEIIDYVITHMCISDHIPVHVLKPDKFGVLRWQLEFWDARCKELRQYYKYVRNNPDHKITTFRKEVPFDICTPSKPTKHRRSYNVTGIAT